MKNVNEPSEKKIPIRRSDVPVSPYVVRMSRVDRLHSPLALSDGGKRLGDDNLQALADSLVIEFDDTSDEAPLCLVENTAHGLTVAQDDVQAQLRESESIPTVSNITSRGRLQRLRPPEPPLELEDILPLEEIEFIGVLTVPPKVFNLPPSASGERKAGGGVNKGQTWLRATLAFAASCALVILPLHTLRVIASTEVTGGEAEAASKVALSQFMRGASSLEGASYGNAQADFLEAARGFTEAENRLGELQGTVVGLLKVIPQTDNAYATAKALVTAGKEFSETAALLSQGVDEVDSLSSADLATKIDILATYAAQALPHAQVAAGVLPNIDLELTPDDVSAKAKLLIQTAPNIVSALQEFADFAKVLTTILGHEQKMRYLVLFQNNTELRPTGGFVGSFAQMDLSGGEITRLDIPGGGTYDVQGQLTTYVAAPGPLQLLRARWEFQDANWFPDFPTSARKFQWFYGQAGGPTTDGVIAVNAAFVAKLLAVLGPIEVPEYGRTFSAENFLFELQKIVEFEYDKTKNAPKAIIGALAPILLERMTSADSHLLLELLQEIGDGLYAKDILVYFNDNELQATAQKLGWTGEIKATSGDYLMVTSTNLGGGKTDAIIDQQLNVQVTLAADGSAEHTLSFTKIHRGMKNAIFTGVNNVDYLRFYVPEGSEFLSASGFEIPPDELFEKSLVPLALDEDIALEMRNVRKDNISGTDIWEEAGKTVFANWMQTAPGETQTVVVKYRTKALENNKHEGSTVSKRYLGASDLQPYSLFIQKQPGVAARLTQVQLSLPGSPELIWSSSEGGEELRVETTNEQDAFWGWLFERP